MTGVLVVPRKIIGWRKGSVPQLFATSTSNVRRPLSKPYGVVNTHLCAYQLHWGRWPFTKYVGCKITKQKGVRRVYSNPVVLSYVYRSDWTERHAVKRNYTTEMKGLSHAQRITLPPINYFWLHEVYTFASSHSYALTGTFPKAIMVPK